MYKFVPLAILGLASVVSSQSSSGAIFSGFQQFSTNCTYSASTDSCPTGYCCSSVTLNSNAAPISGVQVCSAIEANGVFINARNTVNNYTFTCLDSTAPQKWSNTFTSCSRAGDSACGSGCCSRRNGTLFGWDHGSKNVCLAQPSNAGAQTWYGYAGTLATTTINYGWGEVDQYCLVAAGSSSFGILIKTSAILLGVLASAVMF